MIDKVTLKSVIEDLRSLTPELRKTKLDSADSKTNLINNNTYMAVDEEAELDIPEKDTSVQDKKSIKDIADSTFSQIKKNLASEFYNDTKSIGADWDNDISIKNLNAANSSVQNKISLVDDLLSNAVKDFVPSSTDASDIEYEFKKYIQNVLSGNTELEKIFNKYTDDSKFEDLETKKANIEEMMKPLENSSDSKSKLQYQLYELDLKNINSALALM